MKGHCKGHNTRLQGSHFSQFMYFRLYAKVLPGVSLEKAIFPIQLFQILLLSLLITAIEILIKIMGDTQKYCANPGLSAWRDDHHLHKQCTTFHRIKAKH